VRNDDFSVNILHSRGLEGHIFICHLTADPCCEKAEGRLISLTSLPHQQSLMQTGCDPSAGLIY